MSILQIEWKVLINYCSHKGELYWQIVLDEESPVCTFYMSWWLNGLNTTHTAIVVYGKYLTKFMPNESFINMFYESGSICKKIHSRLTKIYALKQLIIDWLC